MASFQKHSSKRLRVGGAKNTGSAGPMKWFVLRLGALYLKDSRLLPLIKLKEVELLSIHLLLNILKLKIVC